MEHTVNLLLDGLPDASNDFMHRSGQQIPDLLAAMDWLIELRFYITLGI